MCDDLSIRLDVGELNKVFQFDIKCGDLIMINADLHPEVIKNHKELLTNVDTYIKNQGALSLFLPNDVTMNDINIKDKVVVLKIKPRHIRRIMNALRRDGVLKEFADRHNAIILPMQDDMDVEALDEKQMNKLGWYRKDDEKRHS